VDLAGARSEVKQVEQTLLQSMLDLQQEKMDELRVSLFGRACEPHDLLDLRQAMRTGGTAASLTFNDTFHTIPSVIALFFRVSPQEMFTDMMEAQMIFMCRGLEELSTGQKSLDIINAEEDLADVRELIGEEQPVPVFEDEHKEHTRNVSGGRGMGG
jgi:hypothetical protein